MKRRSQEARRAETRRLLHEATIRSLMELGYANTSTKAIAERAGLSRGAQNHHYPDKLSLIVAATEHLFHKFSAALANLAGELRADRIDFDGYIDGVWKEMISGDWFYASLEIIVAARGDAELRRRLSPLILDLHERFEGIWQQSFVALEPERSSTRVTMNLMMNVFRGMAVQAVLRQDERYLQEMLSALKEILVARIRPR